MKTLTIRFVFLMCLVFMLGTPAKAENQDCGLIHSTVKDQHLQPILLAFLSMIPPSGNNPSMQESVFLNSMKQQYASRGLCVSAIDASDITLHRKISRNEVAIAASNWGFNFLVLEDPQKIMRQRFNIKELPAIFLIDNKGEVVNSWYGFTRPAVLAQAIESLLGGPLSKWPQTVLSK